MSEETKGTPEEPTPSTEPPAQPEPSPSGEAPPEDRTMGMLCHLLALSGLITCGVGTIVGPLIIWLIKKDQSSFVNDQGKESLNFQISVLIAGVALGILSFILGYIPVIGTIIGILIGLAGVAVGIYWLVQVIMATIQANKGIPYRYPIKLELIK